MDTLVIDIETVNFFTDPGVGRNNFGALEISVVGVYSYERDECRVFEAHELDEFAELVRSASRIVGFASNRYDIPVLNRYLARLGVSDIWNKERIDLLELVESATGHRISLDRLAEANLGLQKSGHGSDAPDLYRQGRIDELKKYCAQDVMLTKQLFDLYERDRVLLIPDRKTGESVPVQFARQPASLFKS